MENLQTSGVFAEALEDAKKEVEQSKAVEAATVAEETVDAGEPVVEETKLEPAPPLPARVKLEKYTIRLALRKGALFTPPDMIFIGGGDAKAKYIQWLENRFKKFFAVKPGTEGQALGVGDIKAPESERLFVKWLTLIAVVLEEAETINWVVPRHPKIDIVDLLVKFVKANQPGLLDLAPYFGILKDEINPQPQHAAPAPEVAVVEPA